MKTTLAALVSLMSISTSVLAQSDTSLLPLRLFGGIEAGLSLHDGSMRRISTIPSCCAEFTSGTGLSFAIGGGIETPLGWRIGDGQVHLGARISYQALGASMREDEFIGNIIGGSTVTSGIARHDLSIGYAVLGVSPYLSFPLPIEMPLRVNVGFTSGIPLGATFEQSETLVDPTASGYTFANGSRTRNVGSGDIPNTSGLYAAITAGVSYEYALSPTLAIAPSITYQRALTSIATTVSWSAHALRAGVDLRVRLAKPVPPPPPPPPVVPPPPPPPRIAELRSDLQIEAPRTNGVIELIGSDNTVSATVYEAAPVLFFQAGSTMPVDDATSKVGMYQQRIIEGLRAYAAEHPSARITVIGSAVTDEPAQLARERVTWAVAQLGLDAMSRIEVRTEVTGGFEHPQLADEKRSVRFLIDRVPMVVPVVQRDTTRRTREVAIPIMHILTCEAGPCTSVVSATFGGRRVDVLGNGPVYRVQIPTSNAVQTTEALRVTCTVVDSTGATKTSTASANVTIAASSTELAPVRVQPTYLQDETVLLGYCDFDDDEFSTTNPNGVRRVKEALAAGKRITLIASSDELGDTEYNDALMERRARAAMRLLQARAADVTIVRQPSTAEANTTPMQRIANRSVRAMIK